MNLSQRIEAFQRLGSYLETLNGSRLASLISQAVNQNPWFVEDHVKTAIQGIGVFLNPNNLQDWTNQYNYDRLNPKRVGVVMAGNIPLVGFHDLLTVLISGHSAQVKLSSTDGVLMNHIIDQLLVIQPLLKDKIQLIDKVNGAEAVIATGSDNTARYFDYYFQGIPRIIRKNRTSCAVITGTESDRQLVDLGRDIFLYFGLGCRNVSISEALYPRRCRPGILAL